jgi:hypothetical protein
MKCVVATYVFTSMLLASGILLILVPCIQYDNWWPLLTIFVLFLAILFPMMCGGCSPDTENNEELVLISWVFTGMFIVTGYSIPSILLRGKYIPEAGLIFSTVGGTVILLSILVFVRIIYFKKDASMAYVL